MLIFICLCISSADIILIKLVKLAYTPKKPTTTTNTSKKDANTFYDKAKVVKMKIINKSHSNDGIDELN